MLGRPWPAAGDPLFTAEDTHWALALHEQERSEAAERCPLCGLPKSICRDPGNQFAFAAEQERCHSTNALLQAKSAQGGDDVSKGATAWSARLKERATS